MQNVGIALVTILVPLSIVLLQESDYKVLDYYSILEYVIDVRRITFAFIFIFTPAFFWHLATTRDLKFIAFFFWFWGVWLMFYIFNNSYKWIKGDKYALRFGYLKKLANPKDTIETWQSIWESEKTNSLNEEAFTEIFIKNTSSNIINMDLVPTVSKVLDDYNFNIEKRHTFSVLFRPDFFKAMLSWHKITWEKEESLRLDDSEGRIQEWSSYDQLSRTLRSLLTSIENLAFDRNEFSIFIQTLKEHISDNKSLFRKPKDKEWYYINELFNYFYPIFFEKAPESKQKFDIFEHYLPLEWRVTSSNWDSDENRVYAVMTFNNFQEWAASRIWNSKEEWDKQLEDIVEAIFPETDPLTLAPIFIYRYNSANVKQAVEKPWNFGLTGNFISYTPINDEEDDELFIKAMDKQRDETIKLAIRLFPQIFHKDRIDGMLTQAKGVKGSFETNSDQYKKAARLGAIFQLFKKELG